MKTKTSFKSHLMIFFIFITLGLNAQKDEVLKESYNYAEIASHPRLLLKKEEEKDLKKSINAIGEFKKIDTYINEVSDELLNKEPLTFVMKGKRLLAVSRSALTRLYYLSYSYRITGDTKYLNRAELELNAVCDFESWNPSHFLDVGEMCMGVSIAYDWLYNDLQESTKEKVRKAILEKAFEPSYIEKYSWFLKVHSNWNSVCNAGLVYGALAIMDHEKEKCIPIIERALKSNMLPLEVYAPDGNYPEGPGYWNYGTTFEVMLMAALESALGSDNGLSNAPGFMKTGNYMLFSNGSSGYYFNYYDCGGNQDACSSMFWFANKTQNPSLVFQELDMINNGEYTKAVSSDIERILPNTLVFGKSLNLSKIKKPTQNMFVGHGLTPVTIVRSGWDNNTSKYFGIKAGSASDGHSHMDQGTFVYDIGRLRWAMDFGMQSYLTLESKGVDLWNLKQDAQRWDVFRYNNFNHNTLSLNNKKHNVNGRAKIIETFENKKELGAKIDLTEVLNFENELKTATRKAVVVDDTYLKIEDFIETNSSSAELRWNMVTPATAKILDKNTIQLAQQGKILILKFESDVPFKLVIRPSENPSDYKCEFGNFKYGAYNQKNPGTVMLGFDAEIPANTTAKFTVTFEEGASDLALADNIIVLDAPNPSTASEGNTLYSDISPIAIGSDGGVYAMEMPDWNPFGKITNKSAMDKSFKFRIDTKKITPSGIVEAGIDRASNGDLGIRGGEGNGIDNNEGLLLSLDLREFDSSVTFRLQKIAFSTFDASESCIIVNRMPQGRMLSYNGSMKDLARNVRITSNHVRRFVDVSSLNLSLRGGINHNEFLSLFSTSPTGNFRVSGFEFVVD